MLILQCEKCGTRLLLKLSDIKYAMGGIKYQELKYYCSNGGFLNLAGHSTYTQIVDPVLEMAIGNLFKNINKC